MTGLSVAYCKRRIREEKRAVAQATCPEAAVVHDRLADEYATLARDLRSRKAKTNNQAGSSLSVRWRPAFNLITTHQDR